MDDNVVKYFLYPLNKNKDDLRNLINAYAAFLNSKFELHSHIWQHESIRFWPSKDASLPQISGWIRYGDNVEDEWLVVFLLLQLTIEFKDLIIRVCDDDGEFILIEAADFLPKWIKPETAENRVFLYCGTLHIIPRKNKSSSLIDMLSYIRNNPSSTQASIAIQRSLSDRISGYPENITKLMHYAVCFLPKNLALILAKDPNLISSIVESFCQHNGINDAKIFNNTKYFPPEILIKMKVKFNRCLYAQLLTCKFVSCHKNFPIYNNFCKADHPDFKAYDLGHKLVIGAELLCHHGTQYKADFPDSESENKKWLKYLSSLQESGYFRDELKGSKSYTKLLESAKIFFFNSIDLNEGCAEKRPGIKMLEQLEDNRKEIEIEILNLIVENGSTPGDDDSWMDVGPTDLDQMLARMFPNQKCSDNLTDLAPSLDCFINNESNFDGVQSTCEESVNLDPESFLDYIKSLKNEDRKTESAASSSNSEDDSSQSDLDDYDSDDLVETRAETTQSLEMEEYMDEMDRQLAATQIGKSFLKLSSCQSQRHQTDDNSTNDLSDRAKNSADIFDQSKRSKKKAFLIDDFNFRPDEARSFPSTKDNRNENARDNLSSKACPNSTANENNDLNEDIFDSLDVDYNLVKNFLDSYSEQSGVAGPVSSILHGLGMRLPAENIDN